MAKKERKQIGMFVVTSNENLNPNGIFCAMCEKQLTVYDPQSDEHIPTAEELHTSDAVAVPNFGWFCSQDCAIQYEKEYKVRFQRNDQGKISYYP